jgi:enterochelin esterase-like enzyme
MNLEPLKLPSSRLAADRQCWLQHPITGNARSCLIFLDGELYKDRVGAPAIVDRLQQANQLPPTACIYISAIDAAARHRELTCNPQFADYIARDLVPWIDETQGGYQHYFLCGLSLSGLAAIFTHLRQPGLFSGALCQSPSAWWSNEWLTESVKHSISPTGKIWISVGDQELQFDVTHGPTGLYQGTSQLESVRRLAQKLKSAGGTIRANEFHGGHDTQCWGAELPLALRWLVLDID